MPKQPDRETPMFPAHLSKPLLVVVVSLLVLPLVVSWPAHQFMLQWLQPQLQPAVLACMDAHCPAVLDLERRGLAMALAPSFLFALLSVLLGAVGLLWMCWRRPLQKHVVLFTVSLIGGVIWVGILALAWHLFGYVFISM